MARPSNWSSEDPLSFADVSITRSDFKIDRVFEGVERVQPPLDNRTMSLESSYQQNIQAMQFRMAQYALTGSPLRVTAKAHAHAKATASVTGVTSVRVAIAVYWILPVVEFLLVYLSYMWMVSFAFWIERLRTVVTKTEEDNSVDHDTKTVYRAYCPHFDMPPGHQRHISFLQADRDPSWPREPDVNLSGNIVEMVYDAIRYSDPELPRDTPLVVTQDQARDLALGGVSQIAGHPILILGVNSIDFSYLEKE
jgi:hypothetical protein